MHKAERVRFPFPDYQKSLAAASSTEHYKYCLTKFVLLSFYFSRRVLFIKRVLHLLLLVRTIIFLTWVLSIHLCEGVSSLSFFEKGHCCIYRNWLCWKLILFSSSNKHFQFCSWTFRFLFWNIFTKNIYLCVCNVHECDKDWREEGQKKNDTLHLPLITWNNCNDTLHVYRHNICQIFYTSRLSTI